MAHFLTTTEVKTMSEEYQAELAILRVAVHCLLTQAVGKTAIRTEIERTLPLLVATRPDLEQQLRKEAGMCLEFLK